MISPLVVFLLAAAIIAGSLSWPAVAGGLFLLALLAHGIQPFVEKAEAKKTTAEDADE